MMIEHVTQQPMGTWQRLFYAGPSADALHEDYAKRGHIDDRAPIATRCEILVDAPVERVWEQLSQPEQWPHFAPEIRDVQLDEGVVEDGHFTWRNGRTKLTSRFAVVNPRHELTWTGRALGSKVVHRHLLAPAPNGQTRLATEESMAGPFLVLFYSSAKLRASLDIWLTAIADAALVTKRSASR